MPTRTTLTCAHPRQLLPEISSRITESEFGGLRIRIDGPGIAVVSSPRIGTPAWSPTDDQRPQPGSPKSLKLGPPPLVAFRRVYGAGAHQAGADGANASFGGAELQAIAECGCRHASNAATRHEPPDRLFDGPSTRRTSPLPAPVQSTLNTRRTVKAATTRAGSDFPPSSGLRVRLRREDRLFFGQRAANRLRRAQRSTAANQRADLAAVRARIQRRKQYLCRRAM
jgi:hypothetical protein